MYAIKCLFVCNKTCLFAYNNIFVRDKTFEEMKIAIFCSANENIDPDFFEMTEALGRWMAEKPPRPYFWRHQPRLDELCGQGRA